jgi:hypothetical protein
LVDLGFIYRSFIFNFFDWLGNVIFSAMEVGLDPGPHFIDLFDLFKGGFA